MRRPLACVALASTLATAACTAAPSEETSATTDDLVAGSVCATLDYGPRPASPGDLYRFFANDEEVSANIRGLLASGILGQAVGPGATLRGVNGDATSVRLVGEVFEGFKRAFPHETAGLDRAPPVVVIESRVANAFAMASTFEGGALTAKSPWFFIVNSALLDHGNTEDELRAVFAHEIGHLVLQTFRPDVQARVRHAYRLGGPSEDGVLGEAQADDPSLADPIGRLLSGQARAGSVSQLGMNMIAPGAYFRILASMLVPTAATSGVCRSVQAKAQGLALKQYGFLPGVAEGNLAPRSPSAAEKAELDRLTDSLVADLAACAGPNADTSSLAIVSALLQQLSPAAAENPSDPAYAQIRAGMLAIERQVDAEMPGAKLSDKMLRADALVRADLVTLRSDATLNLPHVRVYDFEEDADDAAMRVLRAIGKDPTAIGGFTLSILPAAAKAACVADVAAGKPIAFGELYDVHPLHCWRYYHAREFSKALASCSSSPSSTRRAPLTTHLPLIVHDPNSRFMTLAQ